MNGAAVEISIESLTTVKKCVLQCLQELGMQSIFSKAENFTLMEYLRLHNGQKIERYLDDSDKVRHANFQTFRLWTLLLNGSMIKRRLYLLPPNNFLQMKNRHSASKCWAPGNYS
jgi:hypothetical protein